MSDANEEIDALTVLQSLASQLASMEELRKAYALIRRTQWDRVVARGEALARTDRERDMLAMFRATAEFQRAFLATKKGAALERVLAEHDAKESAPAPQPAQDCPASKAFLTALLEQLCACPECAAKRAAGAQQGQVH